MAPKKRAGKSKARSAKGRPGAKRRKPGPKQPSEDLVNYTQMQALSNRVRVRVLAILCERVASPKEISEELNEELGQVCYHISVLRERHLIVADHKVRVRGTVEHFYRAAASTLIPPSAWDNLPPGVRKGISVNLLQEFFNDASASMKADVFDEPPGELSWTPLILDTLGVEEFGKLSRDFLASVLELQANASKRLPKKKDNAAVDAVSATVFLASFLSARSPEDGKKASATKRR